MYKVRLASRSSLDNYRHKLTLLSLMYNFASASLKKYSARKLGTRGSVDLHRVVLKISII